MTRVILLTMGIHGPNLKNVTSLSKIQSEDEVEKMEGDKLIMKMGLDDTFGYKSSYWTNDNLLNENSAPNVEENAKYATFLNTRFNNITVCLESETENCYSHKFSNNKIWSSAKELFSAGYSQGWRGTFGIR